MQILQTVINNDFIYLSQFSVKNHCPYQLTLIAKNDIMYKIHKKGQVFI